METIVIPSKEVKLEFGKETTYQILEHVNVHKLRLVLSSGINMLGKKVRIKAYGSGAAGPSMDFNIVTLTTMHNQYVDVDVHLANTWRVERLTIEPLQDDNWPIFVAVESIG